MDLRREARLNSGGDYSGFKDARSCAACPRETEPILGLEKQRHHPEVRRPVRNKVVSGEGLKIRSTESVDTRIASMKGALYRNAAEFVNVKALRIKTLPQASTRPDALPASSARRGSLIPGLNAEVPDQSSGRVARLLLFASTSQRLIHYATSFPALSLSWGGFCAKRGQNSAIVFRVVQRSAALCPRGPAVQLVAQNVRRIL